MTGTAQWAVHALLPALFLACRAGDAPPFDAEFAWEVLKTQVEAGPRVPGTGGHRVTLAYLQELLERYADEVELEQFTVSPPGGDTLSLTNVVAHFRSGEGRPVLLAAHWDTRPRADQEIEPARRDLPIPGANDGASGVAVLLGVARALAQSPPPGPVDIVLFDGEDWGAEGRWMYLGSKEFARRHAEYRPRMGILLDMVADRDLRILQEGYSLQCCPAVVELVWETAARLGYGAFFPPRLGPYVLDDHIPLIEAGMRVINLIDFDYPAWHTLGDDLTQVSRESLAVVGRVVMEILFRSKVWQGD